MFKYETILKINAGTVTSHIHVSQGKGLIGKVEIRSRKLYSNCGIGIIQELIGLNKGNLDTLGKGIDLYLKNNKSPRSTQIVVSLKRTKVIFPVTRNSVEHYFCLKYKWKRYPEFIGEGGKRRIIFFINTEDEDDSPE